MFAENHENDSSIESLRERVASYPSFIEQDKQYQAGFQTAEHYVHFLETIDSAITDKKIALSEKNIKKILEIFERAKGANRLNAKICSYVLFFLNESRQSSFQDKAFEIFEQAAKCEAFNKNLISAIRNVKNIKTDNFHIENTTNILGIILNSDSPDFDKATEIFKQAEVNKSENIQVFDELIQPIFIDIMGKKHKNIQAAARTVAKNAVDSILSEGLEKSTSQHLEKIQRELEVKREKNKIKNQKKKTKEKQEKLAVKEKIEAEEACRKKEALEDAASAVEQKELLAKKYCQQGDEAVEILEKIWRYQQAIDLDSNYYDAYIGLTRAYALKKDITEKEAKAVRESFEKAITINPECMDAYFGLGDFLHISDPTEQNCLEAIENYEKGIERFGAEKTFFKAIIYVNYGYIFELIDAWDLAIENYKKALEYNPDSAAANERLDFMGFFEKKPSERNRTEHENCIKYYTQAVQFHPIRFMQYKHVILAHLSLKEYAKADDAIDMYYQLMLENNCYKENASFLMKQMAYLMLADCSDGMKDVTHRYNEVIRLFQKTITADPTNPEFHFALGSTLQRMAFAIQSKETPENVFNQEAKTAYSKALKTDAHKQFYHFALGNLALINKEYQEGIEHYLKGLSHPGFDWDNCDALFTAIIFSRLGYMYYNSDKKEISLELYRRALQCNPWILEKSRDYEEFSDLEYKKEIDEIKAAFIAQIPTEIIEENRQFFRGDRKKTTTPVSKSKTGASKKEVVDNSNHQKAGNSSKENSLMLDQAEQYFQSAEIKQRNLDVKGAIEGYNEAIKLNPKFYLAYCSRGFIQANQLELKPAKIDFEAAISIDPEQPNAYKGLAMLYQIQQTRLTNETIKIGLDVTVKELYEKAFAKDKDKKYSVEIFSGQGDIEMRNKRYAEAVALYQEAVESPGFATENNQVKAAVYHKLGMNFQCLMMDKKLNSRERSEKFQESKKYYALALEFQPGHIYAQTALNRLKEIEPQEQNKSTGIAKKNMFSKSLAAVALVTEVDALKASVGPK